MADDIQKCLEIYQEQLNNGYIRVAYVTLTKYVAELKANFPKAYTTSSVAFGYLYYTYFYFTNIHYYTPEGGVEYDASEF